MNERDIKKCDEVLELLPAYQDGELTPDQIPTVERHLAECSKCREALDELELVATGLRDLPEIEPSDGFTHAVTHEAFRAERRRLFLRRLVGYAAAAVIVFSVGLRILDMNETAGIDVSVELPNLGLLGDEEYLGLANHEVGISGDLELEELILDEPA